MRYSVVDLARSLDLASCRIINTPNLIFLCGGKCDGGNSPQSARDFFHRHLKSGHPSLADRVRLAEHVNGWFREDVFPDLLELETYLAGLSDLTILFVESAGSIAELGAFAASDTLRPKTLAVINLHYGEGPSFIADGPLRKISKEGVGLLHYYNWNPDDFVSSPAQEELIEMAGGLVSVLLARDAVQPVEQILIPGSHGHILLLVADLVRTAGIVTITDITDCLAAIVDLKSSISAADISPRSLVNRYLSLLESLQLITHRRNGDQMFYLSTTDTSFIRYAYRDEAPLNDPTRIGVEIRDSLDRVPARLLKRFLQARMSQNG